MQNIFAFKQCQQANFNIAKDLIKVQFSPDLNSMEPQNADELKEKKKVALELFENNYLDKDIPASKVSSSELLEAAQGAVDFYYKQAKKDMDFLRKTMVKSAEDIHNTYLLLLLLLVEIAELEEADIEEKKQKALKKNLTVDLTSLTYSSNKIIMMIKQHKELQIEALRNKVDWSGQRDLLKQVYKELSKTAEFLKYTEGKEHSFEEDKDFVLDVVADELQSEGKIRKSGRGLIDNK